MSINDPDLILFRISTSKLDKIKERKYFLNTQEINKKDSIEKCSICWETSNIDYLNSKCLSCNYPMIKNDNNLNIDLDTESKLKETKSNKVITKKKKIYFNNYFYDKENFKKSYNVTNSPDKKNSCDSNCKCLIM